MNTQDTRLPSREPTIFCLMAPADSTRIAARMNRVGFTFHSLLVCVRHSIQYTTGNVWSQPGGTSCSQIECACVIDIVCACVLLQPPALPPPEARVRPQLQAYHQHNCHIVTSNVTSNVTPSSSPGLAKEVPKPDPL